MGKDERRLSEKKTGKLLTDDELEKVNGGAQRSVYNDRADYGIIRSGPGLEYDVVARVNNGVHVNTTGNTKKADGHTWYEIDSPGYGWIVGELIGYK